MNSIFFETDEVWKGAEWHGKIRKGSDMEVKHVFVFYVDSVDCHFLFINERYSNKNIIIHMYAKIFSHSL